MKKVMAACTAALAALAWPGALAAHHSLVQFDTTTPVWVKGTVIRFDPISPHVRIYLDETKDGQTRRWSVDGPAPNALARMRIGADFLKAGDVMEVCGFPLKAEVEAQRPPAPVTSSPTVLSGRPLSGHLLVMPNGQRRLWSDYGVLEKCLLPGETREQLRQEAFGWR